MDRVSYNFKRVFVCDPVVAVYIGRKKLLVVKLYQMNSISLDQHSVFCGDLAVVVNISDLTYRYIRCIAGINACVARRYDR